MRPHLVIAALLSLAAPQNALAVDEPQAMKPVIMRFLGAFVGERPHVSFVKCRTFRDRTTDCHYRVSISQWTLGELSILLGEAGEVTGAVYAGVCEYEGERNGSPIVELIVALGDHDARAARSIVERLKQKIGAGNGPSGKTVIDDIEFSLFVANRECSLWAVRQERPYPSKVPT